MPAKTPKQQRFMAMCKHNPSQAYGKCPPKKVAEEFSHKPKGGYSHFKGASLHRSWLAAHKARFGIK